MTACIVGWAHTPFGKLSNETVESLIVRVAVDALADAGIGPKDVDEIVLGHFNAGFSPQDFTAALVLQASPDLRFKRATRVENACATGSAAVHYGLKTIAAKSARIVLVVGVEQMTATPAAEIGRNLLKASYVREEADIDGGVAGICGKIAALYCQRCGDQSEALVRIAAEHVQDYLPMSKRDVLKFEGCAEAWKRAIDSAGVGLFDLSFVETHDCFTIAELMECEAMGLVPEGQGARAIADGLTEKNGRLPVNPSGGLKAKGHPIGATGVSMHALTAMQLTGAAGDMQIKDPTLGGIFNMGGAGVANYVSILERIK